MSRLLKISAKINHQRNLHRITIGSVVLHFSYDTCVAVEGYAKDGTSVFAVRENEWGTITGRHLNVIDGGSREAKARRLGETEFMLKACLVLLPKRLTL